MYKGFHHIGLYSRDVARSVKFYEEAFGGKVKMSFGVGPGKEIFMVELAEGAVVEIIPREEVGSAGEPWAHICLWTTDCRGDFDRAVKAGAEVQSEPHEGGIGGWMCNAFLVGPDGEKIELFQTEK